MKPLRDVIFRCDFGGKTGWGHVVRCSALAQALQGFQVPTTLLTAGDVESLPKSVRESFGRIIQAGEPFPDIGFWKKLLGADSRRKAVVVDHYLYRNEKLTGVKDLEPRLVVIDDDVEADLSAADLVVNPGLAAGLNKYGSSHKVLAGPAYALLRPQFRRVNHSEPNIEIDPNSVLIMPGGTDPYNIGSLLLEWLAGRAGKDLRPVIAGSGEALDQPSLKNALGRFSRYKCLRHAGPEELSNWMSVCARGITACGGTVYEMAAVGLPFLGVVVAENQKAMGSAIKDKWGLPVLEKEALAADSLNEAWEALRRNHPPGRRLQIRGLDGRGALRVAEEILHL